MNVTHSCDSLLVRELKRRAGYDRTWMQEVHTAMKNQGVTPDMYASDKFVSLRTMENWRNQSTSIQCKLMAIIEQTMNYPAYDVVTVH